MYKKVSKIKLIGLGTAGLLLLPLTGLGASASTDSGGFEVKAQDVEGTVATAGMEGTVSGNPGGGSDNGGGGSEEDAERVVFTYQAGPLTVDVTNWMIERSQKNWDAYQGGNHSATDVDPTGWSVLVEYAPGTTDVIGPVKEGAKPTRIGALNAKGEQVIRAYEDSEVNRDLADYRDLSAVGNLVEYKLAPSQAIEGRVVELGGSLKIERQSVLNGGLSYVERYEANTSMIPVASPYVWRLHYLSGGAYKVTSVYTDPFIKDDYSITESPDFYQETHTYKSRNFGIVLASNGAPSRAQWTTAGVFEKYFGAPSNNNRGGTVTVAQWNAQQGTNWDGKKMDTSHLQGKEPSFVSVVLK